METSNENLHTDSGAERVKFITKYSWIISSYIVLEFLSRAFTILASLLEKLQHTSVFVPETFIDKNVSHEYHSWLLYNTRQNRTILKNLDPTH